MNHKINFYTRKNTNHKFVSSVLCKLLITVFILQTFLFISCKDNQVSIIDPSTPQVIDSSFFDWKFIRIPNYSAGEIYVADSNNIFITTATYVYHYKDSIFNIIGYSTAEDQKIYISGSNEKNVYIGGTGGTPVNSFSKIWHWNGETLVDIQLPEDTSQSIRSIYIQDESNVWFSTESVIVYHYDGINIKSYNLPARIIDSKFHIINGVIYLIGNNYFPAEYDLFYSFKFENDSWKIVTEDTVIDNNSVMGDRFGTAGDDFLREGKNSLFEFTGYSWNKLFDAPQFEYYHSAGYSKQEFLIYGFDIFSLPTLKMYYYKNGIWYFQSNYWENIPYGYHEVGLGNFKFVNNVFYGYFPSYGDTYLIIARYKQ
ncbi:MAG: hypothetical protein EHM58_08550 [Ignavibacteriae bacterium]|nr:MAG: hypothetical protein EHM58_08550 [Ignavibacteriota bacterium]